MHYLLCKIWFKKIKSCKKRGTTICNNQLILIFVNNCIYLSNTTWSFLYEHHPKTAVKNRCMTYYCRHQKQKKTIANKSFSRWLGWRGVLTKIISDSCQFYLPFLGDRYNRSIRVHVMLVVIVPARKKHTFSELLSANGEYFQAISIALPISYITTL